jgi:hypothetical protein
VLTHFSHATLEFHDAFVESAQFVRFSNHDNHNRENAPLEIDQAQLLGFRVPTFESRPRNATKLIMGKTAPGYLTCVPALRRTQALMSGDRMPRRSSHRMEFLALLDLAHIECA